jgi:putative hydrolase of the HAD superfamily
VKKPDPRAFEIALAAMGAPPERVLFLDDVAENVAAARGLGLHAHRHTDTVETLAILRSAAGSA